MFRDSFAVNDLDTSSVLKNHYVRKTQDRTCTLALDFDCRSGCICIGRKHRKKGEAANEPYSSSLTMRHSRAPFRRRLVPTLYSAEQWTPETAIEDQSSATLRMLLSMNLFIVQEQECGARGCEAGGGGGRLQRVRTKCRLNIPIS